MFTFHEGVNRRPEKDNNISVFDKDGEPISADQRSELLIRLNRLDGLDPDGPLWGEVRSGGDLRVAVGVERKNMDSLSLLLTELVANRNHVVTFKIAPGTDLLAAYVFDSVGVSGTFRHPDPEQALVEANRIYVKKKTISLQTP